VSDNPFNIPPDLFPGTKWRSSKEVPALDTFHLTRGLHPFEFELGETVEWRWKSATREWSGTGQIVDRYYKNPGLSSPADFYVIRNENAAPFPFIRLDDKSRFDGWAIKDASLYEFIYGALLR
jgi:hypothetical protein